MECRDWRERISASVDGEVPPEEARLVEEHLEGCAECRALERKMRAVGIGIERTEGVVPPDFREKLFARMEAEDLLPRRRSLFVFSLRWAAIPAAAAAALALFLLTSADRRDIAVSPPDSLPRVVQQPPSTEPREPASPADSPGPGSPASSARQTAPPASQKAGGQLTASQAAGEQLTAEEREIIANLDILEDPSDLDPNGDVDEMEIFEPPSRSRG